MVGGQALDLAADKYGDPPAPDAAHVRRLQAMKTGALIACATELGAILGRATPDQRQALIRYGEAIGLAFQISDDLLDAEGDADVVGKAVAKDSAAGKATLVSILGIEAARAELKLAEQRAIDALAMFAEKAAVLRETASFIVKRTS
jgi:farnesyl diphosphate synthase